MVTGWTAALSPSTLRTRPLKSLPPGRQNGRSRARLSRAQGDLPHHQRHRKCVRPQFPGLSPGGLGPHLTSSGFPLQAFLRFPVCPPGPPLRPPSSGFPSSGFLRFVPFGRCPGSGPPPGSLPLSNLHVSAAVRRLRRRWSQAAGTKVTSPAATTSPGSRDPPALQMGSGWARWDVATESPVTSGRERRTSPRPNRPDRRLLARCHGSASVTERDCESRTARRPAWPACRGHGGLPPQQAHWNTVTLDGSVPVTRCWS